LIIISFLLIDGSVGGTAMTTFTVNSSPSKGVCDISPNSGVELTTQFKYTGKNIGLPEKRLKEKDMESNADFVKINRHNFRRICAHRENLMCPSF
jgi:hypothetical protein